MSKAVHEFQYEKNWKAGTKEKNFQLSVGEKSFSIKTFTAYTFARVKPVKASNLQKSVLFNKLDAEFPVYPAKVG